MYVCIYIHIHIHTHADMHRSQNINSKGYDKQADLCFTDSWSDLTSLGFRV